jgi:xyloglucan-specific exo-beta-1,4-glucanase
MKERVGRDNLAIAWEYPGQNREVIPGTFSRVTNPFQVGANLDSWTGIGGTSIEDLRSGTNNLANMPDKSELLKYELEAPSNWNDNYGSRMNGWLVPPVTADYVFWIASDDNGELWLSTDDDPANKILACRQPFSASSRYWDRFQEQKSGIISLVAGQIYYYEVRLIVWV